MGLICCLWKSGLVSLLRSSDLRLRYHLHHLLDGLLNILGIRVALYLINQVLGKLGVFIHHIFKLRQLQDLLNDRMECFLGLFTLRLLLKPQLLQVLLLLDLQVLLLLHLLHLQQHHLMVVCLYYQSLILEVDLIVKQRLEVGAIVHGLLRKELLCVFVNILGCLIIGVCCVKIFVTLTNSQ